MMKMAMSVNAAMATVNVQCVGEMVIAPSVAAVGRHDGCRRQGYG
jgi:hypothetical protein